MFGIADLVTSYVIEQGFRHLVANPSQLHCILGLFEAHGLDTLVGPRYVKDCMDLILNNKIAVGPHYNMDLRQKPSISVIASYAEDQIFIGGGHDLQQIGEIQPRVVQRFDAHQIKTDSVMVSKGYNLTTKFWHGLVAVNGADEFKIIGIIRAPEGTDYDELLFDRMFSEEELARITPATWVMATGTRSITAEMHASIDKITVQMRLVTTGDYEVHRLMATVTRWALKWGRSTLLFQRYGIMEPIFSQTPPVGTDDQEPEMETVFTLNGQMTDSWLARTTVSPERIDICLVADRDNPGHADEDDVELNLRVTAESE